MTEPSWREFLPDFDLVSARSANSCDEGVVTLHHGQHSDRFSGLEDVGRLFADDDASLRRLPEQAEHRHVHDSGLGVDVDDDLRVLDQVPLALDEPEAHFLQEFGVVAVGAVDERAAEDGVTGGVRHAVAFL